MAVRSKEDAASLRRLARSMYFSNSVIDGFLESASAAEARCVSELIAAELSSRERNKRARLFRKAAFPQVKSFDGYDFSQVSFPDGYTSDDLMSLSFVERAEDFLFLGPTGRGKTHLAIAVGSACVERGMAVRFFTTAQLVLMLTKASRAGELERLMGEIARCDLVVLDEFGYVPIDVEGARLLFQVMSSCYEKRSMVITTNIEFAKWGVVLGDDKLASAAIDRLVHHGRLVEFGGTSRRMEEALMLGKGGNDAAR
jgi:DNA replication protein DnaC